jgi:hypothetical protein
MESNGKVYSLCRGLFPKKSIRITTCSFAKLNMVKEKCWVSVGIVLKGRISLLKISFKFYNFDLFFIIGHNSYNLAHVKSTRYTVYYRCYIQVQVEQIKALTCMISFYICGYNLKIVWVIGISKRHVIVVIQ